MSFDPTTVPRTRIATVDAFEALLSTPFADGVNAIRWTRALPGNFGEVAAALGSGEGIETLDRARLEALELSPAGRVACDVMLADLDRLRAHGLEPELNCIHGYPEDDPASVVPTDVHSFHVDSAPIEIATWLCTYHGPASQGLHHQDARRRIDVPETRAALLAAYGGADDEGFREFLSEHCYDRHYVPVPGASPFEFGLHHLWRIAVDWPGIAVPPCVHRAPTLRPGERRLLLIS